MKKHSSVLMLKLGGIGDVVTLTPAARAFRKSFPDSFITLCAEKTPSELVASSGLFDEIICFDDLFRCQNYLQFLAPRMLLRIKEFVSQIRGRRYDLYLDFHDLYYFSTIFKPWFVGLASGARERIGLDTDHRGFFLHKRIPTQTYGYDHMIDRCLRVVEAAGAMPDGRHTQIWLQKKDRKFASSFFQTRGLSLSSQKIFCLHPGANIDFPLKFWPLDKFINVAVQLVKSYSAKILLVGGKTDEPLANKLCEALGSDAVNAAGSTSIGQLGALIERCHFYLGADTGPLHMAVALGVPTVGIFGPGNYPAYGTYGDGYSYYHPIWHEVPEFPWTRGKKVRGNPYMDAVSVEEVIEACEKQIRLFVLESKTKVRDMA